MPVTLALQKMVRRHRIIAASVAHVALLCLAVPCAAKVYVYSQQDIPLAAVGDATIVYLDVATKLESQLSADLPTDIGIAQRIVRQRLRDGGIALQQDLVTAYQGLTDAWALGITTLPAVVVERRYVVYGEPDVGRAVERIEAYRRTHP